MIKEMKISTSPEQLGQGFPEEFSKFLTYVKALRFDERPDYAYLKKLFREKMIVEDYSHDFIYDWIILASKKEIEDE